MAAVNYYYGLKRGANANPGSVVVATSSQGTAVDVEVRVQINDGSNATNIKGIDAQIILEAIKNYIVQRGVTGSLGTNLPAN